MTEFRRLARVLRCTDTDPRHRFTHRLRVGLAIAALILALSILFHL